MSVPPDQETIFCQEYAKSGDALDALATSGIRNADGATTNYSPRVLADLLLQRADIQAAIKAYRTITATVEQIEVTHRSIAADMQSVYDAAMKDGDLKAAISSKQLQANVLGLLEQKISITSRKSVDEMTTAELATIAFKGRLIEATPRKDTDATSEGTNTSGSGGGDTAP